MGWVCKWILFLRPVPSEPSICWFHAAKVAMETVLENYRVDFSDYD